MSLLHGSIFGYSLFENSSNLLGSVSGYSLFENSSNLLGSVSGGTRFWDNSAYKGGGKFGRTYFYDYRRFPDINPYYTIIETPIFSTEIVNFEGSSNEQRLSTESTTLYKYTYQWDNLSSADMNTIMDFFVLVQGSCKAFSIPHYRTGDIKIVRFENDSVNIEYFAYNLYRLSKVVFIGVSGNGDFTDSR